MCVCVPLFVYDNDIPGSAVFLADVSLLDLVLVELHTASITLVLSSVVTITAFKYVTSICILRKVITYRDQQSSWLMSVY